MTLKPLAFCALAMALTACATTPDQGAVTKSLGKPDENGFVTRPDMAVFHPGTGLHCPTGLDDLVRVNWSEFRPGIDASCNYEAAGERLTLYAYESDDALMEELQGAVAAALQAQPGRFEFSEAITESCQGVADRASMTEQLTRGLLSIDPDQDNTIEIDTSPGAGSVPYIVAALVGDDTRSYAAVSQSGNWRMKIRYTVIGAPKGEGPEGECRLLHEVMTDAVKSRGSADGIYAMDDVDRLLRLMRAQEDAEEAG